MEGSGAAATAIDLNNTSTGDPKINFQLSGSTTFSMGIDDTDSKFKIGTSALETNTRFTIDASGNVGLGTSSPNAELQLSQTLGNRKLVLYEEANNNHQFIGLGINNGVFRYQSNAIGTDHVFYAATSSTTSNELMRIKSTGFVGIGTASPTTNLHVVGTTILEGSTVVNETGAATNFRVESDANANMLFVNGTTNGVGIGTATPNAALQLGNAEGNRRIVVFENANDNHQFCGFGLNSGEFRYQVGNSGTHHIFYAGTSSTTSTELMRIQANGRVGIGMTPSTNLLEVNGAASKTAAGDWLANSDARLKKDIKQMDSKAVLDKMLALKGITYYWNDTVTGSKRPTQLQYGFTAQNIQEVFPILVEEDNLGYLQTAYGTYDAMYVESMRALQQQIDAQQAIIEAQEREIDALKQNALKVAELENKMNAMLLLLNNKQELTVKQ